MKFKHGLLVALIAMAAWPAVSAATATDGPVAHAAATCANHPNQASAQRAKDTRDSDGDGIYCETLPCPCLPPDPRADGGGNNPADQLPVGGSHCRRPQQTQRLVFSADDYPKIRAHFRGALRRGWPRTLVLNRAGADARRGRL